MEELYCSFPSVNNRVARLTCQENGARSRFRNIIDSRCSQIKDKNTTCTTTINTSLNPSPTFTPEITDDDDKYLTQQIKTKASFMMSLNRTLQAEFKKIPKYMGSQQKKQCKLSFMISPKKKVSKINFRSTCRNRLKQRLTDRARQMQTMKNGEISYFMQQTLQATEITQNMQIQMKLNFNQNICPLQNYFILAFTKFFSKQNNLKIKQRVTVLVQCLAQRYKKDPTLIPDDVKDIMSLQRIVKDALSFTKQNLRLLKPSEGIDINGDLGRLFFNLTHLLSAWKKKNYDLLKIYLELEYYSRKLEFHPLTLKFCFEIGNIFNLRHDQQKSYQYYSKALKLSIYLNDTFNQQKSIDRLGISTYGASKVGGAHYFHENIHNLNSFDRQTIKQNYSNEKQIDLLVIMRKKMNKKHQEDGQTTGRQMLYRNSRQNFNFSTEVQNFNQYQLTNRDNFQKKINKYIASPDMRLNTIIAKDHMNRIDTIGKTKRLKNWEGRLLKGGKRFQAKEDSQSSNSVLLTHRSMNRINPEIQQRQIKRQKVLLVELMGYFTNTLLHSLI